MAAGLRYQLIHPGLVTDEGHMEGPRVAEHVGLSGRLWRPPLVNRHEVSQLGRLLPGGISEVAHHGWAPRDHGHGELPWGRQRGGGCRQEQ